MVYLALAVRCPGPWGSALVLGGSPNIGSRGAHTHSSVLYLGRKQEVLGSRHMSILMYRFRRSPWFLD